MKLTEIYSVQELLLTPTIMGNQSTLAKLLRINRATLHSAIEDVNNEKHIIKKVDGRYVFMAITRRAVLNLSPLTSNGESHENHD
jgi:hypothetical protein